MLEKADEETDSASSDNEATNDFININELWPDLPVLEDSLDDSSVAGISFTKQTLPNVINNLLYTEIRTSAMTNLGNILMGYLDDEGSTQDDSKVGRLSLANEKLAYMPKLVCEAFGPIIKILDISDNNIGNLDFLDYFTELTSLIADKNPISSADTNIPCMPKLELLYLNKCKISNLCWVEALRYNCPKLRFLSLMGNPVVPAFMTTGNVYQYLQYRLYVISAIPNLVHLDDKRITADERAQAKKMFPTPFVHHLLKSTQVRVPHLLRKLTGRTSNYFPKSPVRNHLHPSKPMGNNYLV
ncbi:uncharacterized protein LOC109539230 isoform X1 [Dendroctonus ponderosae]|uniref:uncharacterized protein LOC109539230 isoform X1 n=2 Tax=Dendroctonus ponderosae TaxID=77166 RepID=UPI0020356445|nr:uncharacterized protein LOC109539230 isoform X1 [Dendroctonus ponderosae]XP_048524527.1 uncharacterized protein LOC109539230 isoform X1 [Dendroctonus ponderosae]KAH1012463.1 hypothetical protein HUJ05_011620 [Dendroctonus ponderosae]